MRVTALIENLPKEPEPVQIYRITAPYTILNNQTNHEFMYTSVMHMHESNMGFVRKALKSDIIVLQRLSTPDPDHAIQFCSTLKSGGAKLVYEADDDLTRDFRDVTSNAGCKPFLSQVDAITASTDFLANRMSLYSGGVPSYVIPNYLPLKWYTNRAYKIGNTKQKRERKNQGTVNIMLVGTKTHEEDWRITYEAIINILPDYPNVRLLFGGYKPDYVLMNEQIIFLPYVYYKDYPTMMFEADIVCAGIDPNDLFNHSKSNCKVLESWAAQRDVANKIGGAAIIATDSVVYSGTIEHEEDGLLTEHTTDGWEQAVRRLIEDVELRNKLQINGLKKVRRYSINNHAYEWLTIYTKILNGG